MLDATTIPACHDVCGSPNWSETSLQWCSFPVVKPGTEWASIDQPKGSTDTDKRVCKALSQVHVWSVEQYEEIGPALSALYQSMKDPIIGIDTEWKPDTKARESKVAMVQLASTSCVVLIRTCMLGGLPEEVINFCKDDEIFGCGFDWDNSDEKKMLDSFDKGREDMFSHFVDIRRQAEIMGYQNCSLATLAKHVLGFEPPSSKPVTMSNWESSYLQPRQLRYAALDALLTSDIFRSLRQLHASPSPCRGCPLPLGAWPGLLELQCGHPECIRKKPLASIKALLQHMRQKGHKGNILSCATCGRVSSKDGVVHGLERPSLWAQPAAEAHEEEEEEEDGDPSRMAYMMGGGRTSHIQTPQPSHEVYGADTRTCGADSRTETRQRTQQEYHVPQDAYARPERNRRTPRSSTRQDRHIYAAYNAFT